MAITPAGGKGPRGRGGEGGEYKTSIMMRTMENRTEAYQATHTHTYTPTCQAQKGEEDGKGKKTQTARITKKKRDGLLSMKMRFPLYNPPTAGPPVPKNPTYPLAQSEVMAAYSRPSGRPRPRGCAHNTCLEPVGGGFHQKSWGESKTVIVDRKKKERKNDVINTSNILGSIRL